VEFYIYIQREEHEVFSLYDLMAKDFEQYQFLLKQIFLQQQLVVIFVTTSLLAFEYILQTYL
jgi:hypothetical protein